MFDADAFECSCLAQGRKEPRIRPLDKPSALDEAA
jgi:hypothetical protein